MTQSLTKLIEIGGDRLSLRDPTEDVNSLEKPVEELVGFLAEKNGFYAFESALHVFPSGACGTEIGLKDWNAPALWKGEYQGLAYGYVFFAEDIFGGQFGLGKNGIYQFDPETGQTDNIARNLEGWAEAILREYPVLTGYPLAHQW